MRLRAPLTLAISTAGIQAMFKITAGMRAGMRAAAILQNTTRAGTRLRVPLHTRCHRQAPLHYQEVHAHGWMTIAAVWILASRLHDAFRMKPSERGPIRLRRGPPLRLDHAPKLAPARSPRGQPSDLFRTAVDTNTCHSLCEHARCCTQCPPFNPPRKNSSLSLTPLSQLLCTKSFSCCQTLPMVFVFYRHEFSGFI